MSSRRRSFALSRMHAARASFPVLAAVALVALCQGACAHAPDGSGRAALSRPRGRILQAETGGFRYEYFDVVEPDSHVARLQAMGLHGGGPTWEGIIHSLVELRSPRSLSKLEFDLMGEGIVVWAVRRDTLEMVARLVAEVKEDPALMSQALELARIEGILE